MKTKEDIRAYNREWYANHREEYRKRNREEARRRTALWREQNPERLKALMEKTRIRNNARYHSDPEFRARVNATARKNAFRRRYGITIEQYDAMVAKQNGLCAICRTEPKKHRLHVDHDHGSGKVRALLCGNCNRLIGLAREDPDTLQSAAGYLAAFGLRGAT